MRHKAVEVAGWYGTIVIVGAYALTSFGILKTSDLLYELLNLTGALGIVVESLSKKDYQPGVLNIIWTLIALIAILKILLF